MKAAILISILHTGKYIFFIKRLYLAFLLISEWNNRSILQLNAANKIQNLGIFVKRFLLVGFCNLTKYAKLQIKAEKEAIK